MKDNNNNAQLLSVRDSTTLRAKTAAKQGLHISSTVNCQPGHPQTSQRTQAIMVDIGNRFQTGQSLKAIADKYGVSPWTIRRYAGKARTRAVSTSSVQFPLSMKTPNHNRPQAGAAGTAVPSTVMAITESKPLQSLLSLQQWALRCIAEVDHAPALNSTQLSILKAVFERLLRHYANSLDSLSTYQFPGYLIGMVNETHTSIVDAIYEGHEQACTSLQDYLTAQQISSFTISPIRYVRA